jgi:hypothetical protein
MHLLAFTPHALLSVIHTHSPTFLAERQPAIDAVVSRQISVPANIGAEVAVLVLVACLAAQHAVLEGRTQAETADKYARITTLSLYFVDFLFIGYGEHCVVIAEL